MTEKNFNYTARDCANALRKGTITAADRADALNALMAKGLTPVSVEEGSSLKGSFRLSGLFKPARLGGLAVILVMGTLFLMQGRGRVSTKRTPKARQGQPARPEVASRPPAAAPVPAESTVLAPVEPPEAIATTRPPVLFHGVTVPNTNGLTRRALAKDAVRVLVPGVRRNADTNAPNPYATFRTRSERMMSQVLDAKPGERILDLSQGWDFDKDFAAALENTIEIYPTDTEEMAAHKESVAWMKEEMRKLVKEGRSAAEILSKFREEHNKIADFRSELQSQLSALRKEGKTKEADEFAKEANKMLEPYGTRPLTAFPVFPRPEPKP